MQVIANIHRGVVTRSIIIGAWLIIIAAWCVRDGWFENDFYVKPENQVKRLINRVVAIVAPAIGLGIVVRALALRARPIVADDNGLHQGATHMPWASVSRVDDSELDDKGIVRLYYTPPNDSEEHVWLLDQYRYTNLESVLDVLEARVPAGVLSQTTGQLVESPAHREPEQTTSSA